MYLCVCVCPIFIEWCLCFNESFAHFLSFCFTKVGGGHAGLYVPFRFGHFDLPIPHFGPLASFSRYIPLSLSSNDFPWLMRYEPEREREGKRILAARNRLATMANGNNRLMATCQQIYQFDLRMYSQSSATHSLHSFTLHETLNVPLFCCGQTYWWLNNNNNNWTNVEEGEANWKCTLALAI